MKKQLRQLNLVNIGTLRRTYKILDKIAEPPLLSPRPFRLSLRAEYEAELASQMEIEYSVRDALFAAEMGFYGVAAASLRWQAWRATGYCDKWGPGLAVVFDPSGLIVDQAFVLDPENGRTSWGTGGCCWYYDGNLRGEAIWSKKHGRVSHQAFWYRSGALKQTMTLDAKKQRYQITNWRSDGTLERTLTKNYDDWADGWWFQFQLDGVHLLSITRYKNGNLQSIRWFKPVALGEFPAGSFNGYPHGEEEEEE